MIRIDNKKTTELTTDELQQILIGFNKVFQLDRTMEYQMNQYIQNPFGYSWHNVVYDDDRIIGHICAVPSYYWCNGEKVVFVDGVDAFIFKEYRDGEIFLNQLQSYFDHMKKNGAKLMLGFPDAKVMKLYAKTKVYKKIGEMETYILPYRIGGVKPIFKPFNFISKAFAWSYVYITGLFASPQITSFKIEKDAISYNQTRYKRADGNYYVVKDGDLEFYYKCMSFKGNRAAFLIDVTGKSAKKFNQAVKYILKHNRNDFDVVLYVGNLYFRNSGLIKVPHKYAPKQFNFIIKFFDKSFDNDLVKNIRNWDVNLATYDVI
jgi:hypothetical protein